MKHAVEEVRLKNGARGLLIDVPDATVMSFLFEFRAGNRYVKSKDVYETAHLMEHMAFGANARFSSEQDYELEFTKNGADHNAYTSDLSMVYEAICADFEWDRILDLQRVTICEPKFNEAELEAEKGNVRSELTGYLDNYMRILWSRIQQGFGEDVYTYNQRLKLIKNITLNDIIEHHKRTHTLKNMRFIIAGKLTGRKSTICRQLEAWQLDSGERFLVPKDEIHSASPILVRRKDAASVTFGWSLYLPQQLTNEKMVAMSFLNHILTGTMSSRIFGTARKQGLAYNVFSETSIDPYSTCWDFGGKVNYDTFIKLVDIIVEELQQVLDNKIDDSEIEAAKSYALGRYQMGAQTVSQISSFYDDRYFMDDFIRDYNKIPDSIKKASRECMIETAREFFKNNTWVLGSVSNDHKELLNDAYDRLSKLFNL